jgi:hypothetical protein
MFFSSIRKRGSHIFLAIFLRCDTFAYTIEKFELGGGPFIKECVARCAMMVSVSIIKVVQVTHKLAIKRLSLCQTSFDLPTLWEETNRIPAICKEP